MSVEAFKNIAGLNPEIPNAARVYDYTLGGTHNFESDRRAAEYMFSLIPSTRKWVKMLRAFLQEAAIQLYEEGFRHYVDLASGLPTADHIHTVVPDAKVIYSDKDALTLSQAQVLLENTPNVLYLQADALEPLQLLDSPQVHDFLGGERKVVFGLSGVTVFMTEPQIRKVHKELYDWAAPGSKLYITYESKDPQLTTPQWEQFVGMFNQMGEAFHLYSFAEHLDMSLPWKPAIPIQPLRQFLGLPEDYITEADHENVGLEFYGMILQKE
jgi:hypothetical protein